MQNPEVRSSIRSGNAIKRSEEPANSFQRVSFWGWLFRGSGAGPGIRRFFDRWLVGHLGMGAALAWLVPVSISEAANVVLLPLAGILIGLTFAWAGNAQALLQAAEIEDLAEMRKGGFPEYVFTFQMAVFVLLVTLVAWGLGGLGVFDQVCLWACPTWAYDATKGALFALSSAALRECWQVVVGAQQLLLVRRQIRSTRDEESLDQV
jgi:hypothetical protein